MGEKIKNMTVSDIINHIVELGKTIQNKKHINSLYCFGITPQNQNLSEFCVFLLLISQDATEDDLIKLTTSLKFRLERFADVFIIIHDVNTINQALNNNSQFAFQVLNHAIKLWDFANEENHGL
jgi:hypothetical protein